MFIIGWSFSLSYFVVQHFDFSNVKGTYLFHLSLICLLSLPVVYFSRLHTGLLRYSNTKDMLRIFASVFIFSILFLSVEIGLVQQGTLLYIPHFSILLEIVKA